MNLIALGQVAPPRKLFPNWTIVLLKNDAFSLLIGQTYFKRADQNHSSERVLYFQRVDTIKREMFSQKSVRRFVGDSSAFVMGAMFLASALKRSISPRY